MNDREIVQLLNELDRMTWRLKDIATEVPQVVRLRADLFRDASREATAQIAEMERELVAALGSRVVDRERGETPDA